MDNFTKTISQAIEQLKAGKRNILFAKMLDLNNPPPEMHYHPFPEVALMLSGTSHHHFPSEVMKIYENDLLIIPRGVPHTEYVYATDKPYRVLILRYSHGQFVLHFSKADPDNIPQFDGVRHINCEDSYSLFEYLETASQLYFSDNKNTEPAIDGLIKAFFGRILVLLTEDRDIEKFESAKVLHAYEYIEKNITSPELNVQRIAKDMKCSADYLSHIFSKESGRKLTQYINQKRIERSLGYLTTSNLSIGQIGKACGYADVSYFNRQFKKIMKVNRPLRSMDADFADY
jgi:AraC-like DNA-binding protein/uncharacterized RmlC-like cupin family protein